MSLVNLMLLINSLGLIVFVIRNYILSNKLNKFKSNIDEVKHWINSVDMDSFSTLHDKNYLAKAKKLLRDM